MSEKPPSPTLRELARGGDAYRFLLAEADGGVLLMSDLIEDCNEAACRLFRRPREALVGLPPLELSPPTQPDGADSAAGARRRIQSALAGLPQWFEWQFRDDRGEAIDTLVHVEGVLLDGRRRVLLRLRDLSRLQRAESRLRDTQMRLQQILDNSTNALVYAKDLDGRYLFVNRAFGRLVGLPYEQIVGRTAREVFSPEVASKLEASDRQAIETRASIEVEERIEVAGTLRTALMNKFPLLRQDGTPYAVCGITVDITERTHAEDAIRRAALAVSAAEGEGIYAELVRSLAEILSVDIAFIALPVPDDPTLLRMLAYYVNGRVIEDFDYGMAGTPCETVMGQQYRFYPSRLGELFPRDAEFRSLGLDAYAGLPLTGALGRSLGLIAVVSRKPLPRPELVEAMLKIFATRAVTEIERRRADEALREAEASYRAIFDAAEDPIFVHDWDTGAVIDVNAKACEVYGYTREELLRLGVEEVSSGEPPYTPADAARWIEKAKRAGSVQFEWHRKSRDGTLHWDEVRLKSAVINGRRRLLAFTREITERRLAEEALRASEAQYRAIFNASADALVLRDADFRIVDVNSTYEAFTGFTREQALGADHVLANPPEFNARIKALHGRVLAGEPIQLETRLLHKDGMVRELELRGMPIRHQGRPHVLYAGRDITARKNAEAETQALEAQLRQAQKMEAIGHLTGGIAHDFNNILTSILGYVVLAMERDGAAGDPKVVQYLEQAQRAALRARDLIQQMLTFSRARRGEPRPLELRTLVCEALKLAGSTLPSSIVLDVDLAHETPPVMADPVQAEQVLLNLLINARDAMSGAGTVAVAVGTGDESGAVCASCRKPVRGRFVTLTVRDTGGGIAPEVLDRMFEPFFTTKGVGKGSGMGLSTVHGIVHEHGGHILVRSEPGAGATFRVLLPPLADVAADATATAPAPLSRDRRGMRLAGRVLVVEDETTVGEFVAELLGTHGLEVTLKSDPLEAVQWFAEDPERVDLVLTDQTMPRMTGLELARRLATDRPELPILLYTGFGEHIGADEMCRNGVCALLRKPVEPARLLDLVRTHLARP